MLKLIVDQLADGPVGLNVNVSPGAVGLVDDVYTFKGKVVGRLEFRFIGRDIEGHGEVEARAETPCVRCLEPAEVRLQASIHEIWLWYDPAVEETHEAESEDIMAYYYHGGELDVREPLHELLMVELPDRALCKPDCKGLCPDCGANLNRETCGCASEASSSMPEWKQALKKIKKKT